MAVAKRKRKEKVHKNEKKKKKTWEQEWESKVKKTKQNKQTNKQKTALLASPIYIGKARQVGDKCIKGGSQDALRPLLWGQPTLTPQFSSVTQSCLTLFDPMDCSMSGFPAHHQLLELAQTHVQQVGDDIQPSHPLSSTSPALNLSQHQGLFQWVSSSH